MNEQEISRLEFKLSHAVTEYDRKQSKRRDYNIYALPIYLEGVSDVIHDIRHGASPRSAILRRFNDRLLDFILVSVGETKSTREEVENKPFTYSRL